MTLLMKYLVCSINFKVNKLNNLYGLFLCLQPSVTHNSSSWAFRVCTWFKRPHVCCHICCWGNIYSKRWICSIFFRWGRYDCWFILKNQASFLGKDKIVANMSLTLLLQHAENFYLSYIDPVVIGRKVFHSTDDFVCGVVGSFRDTLCAIVDTVLDTISDINKGLYFVYFWYFEIWFPFSYLCWLLEYVLILKIA